MISFSFRYTQAELLWTDSKHRVSFFCFKSAFQFLKLETRKNNQSGSIFPFTSLEVGLPLPAVETWSSLVKLSVIGSYKLYICHNASLAMKVTRNAFYNLSPDKRKK